MHIIVLQPTRRSARLSAVSVYLFTTVKLYVNTLWKYVRLIYSYIGFQKPAPAKAEPKPKKAAPKVSI